MRENLKYFMAAAVLLLFLPFLLTVLLSGKDAVSLHREPDPEMLLPVALYREIPEGDAPREFLRAQAILIRSRLRQAVQNQELLEILEENLKYEQQHRMYPDLLERCAEAADSTEGQVLTVGGFVVEGPYFARGSGTTRDGLEAMGSEAYAWIVSVDSGADIRHPDYIQEICIPAEKAEEILGSYLGGETAETEDIFSKLSAAETDRAGYVTEMAVGDTRMSGEKFRSLLSLPSSCFTMEQQGDQILFSCRGEGHGRGMSQYGAAVMAKEGKTAEEILKHYFPNASVEQEQN